MLSTIFLLFVEFSRPSLVIPLAGEIHSANGSRFSSTVSVAESAGGARLSFLPAGRGAAGREVVDLPSASGNLPWKRVGSLGGVQIENAESASLLIEHYDPVGNVVGRLLESASEERRGLREGDSFQARVQAGSWRTNLVLFESSNRHAAIELTTRDSAGRIVGSERRTVGAHEQRLLPLAPGVASVYARVVRGPGRIHFRMFSTNQNTGEIAAVRLSESRDDGWKWSGVPSALSLCAIVLGVLALDRRKIRAAREAQPRSSRNRSAS